MVNNLSRTSYMMVAKSLGEQWSTGTSDKHLQLEVHAWADPMLAGCRQSRSSHSQHPSYALWV